MSTTDCTSASVRFPSLLTVRITFGQTYSLTYIKPLSYSDNHPIITSVVGIKWCSVSQFLIEFTPIISSSKQQCKITPLTVCVVGYHTTVEMELNWGTAPISGSLLSQAQASNVLLLSKTVKDNCNDESTAQ